ncbi:PTS glucose transporter subunit IIA [Clostridium sp. JS66]|uniref:PTS sugar transporter subunit IIA n=1 Tax=Clostridium sp. JS66 TaxID=3064705 RepID=UPI00298DF616|nr:PTS glucose transporter subunit IIA [Clostridium sp. JS66]WPC42688.1 PTS glucose transporter subunit IIA [Clostridium sp. JS66]
MFSKLFKKNNDNLVCCPVNGKVVDITEVNDPVFSDKMMGEGVAIIPEDGIICSPVDGCISQIFSTKHAVLIKSKEDLDIIIHIGLETVKLNGEGFNVLVNEGDKVTIGKKLIEVDLEFLKNKGISPITPVIIANHENKNIVKCLGDKRNGEAIMKIK